MGGNRAVITAGGVFTALCFQQQWPVHIVMRVSMSRAWRIESFCCQVKSCFMPTSCSLLWLHQRMALSYVENNWLIKSAPIKEIYLKSTRSYLPIRCFMKTSVKCSVYYRNSLPATTVNKRSNGAVIETINQRQGAFRFESHAIACEHYFCTGMKTVSNTIRCNIFSGY